MDKELDGKVAVVTGASRGIGRSVALALAGRGAAVAVGYVHSGDRAEEVAGEIVSTGGVAVAVRADLSRVDEVRQLFATAEEKLGALDIVVANAADAVVKPVVDCTEEDYHRIFDTNVKGAFFTLQEAARRVRDNGRIIAMSTGGTKMFFTGTSLYLGSKGAVEQFVRVLSRELGERQVTVNAVLPGFTDTDLLPDRDRAVAADMSPFGRVGTPDEVAAVIAFLAGPRAGWVTGQNVGAGGGVF